MRHLGCQLPDCTDNEPFYMDSTPLCVNFQKKKKEQLFVSGSIATWYIFLFFYGMLSPVYSKNAYQILVEVLSEIALFCV
ncbi:hypothetical protein RIF29_25537 [Crotalaria pallida]|uniref:Uncharacterized protein n=1 Tax=Crotalaria pallida TaxID=3830 RepID=A0AAN9ELS9_CROPI